MSDTLSLVVFAICVSVYTTGFSPSGLALLLAEIAGYIALVLFGLSRLGQFDRASWRVLPQRIHSELDWCGLIDVRDAQYRTEFCIAAK
jgi:xanthine/uracil permease